MLAILSMHAGEVVPSDRLIDELWGERPPATAANTLQVYVWWFAGAEASVAESGRRGAVEEVAIAQMSSAFAAVSG